MHDGNILVLRGNEVRALLAGQELAVIETVRRAYQAHAAGDSSLPHSTFLRFPDNQNDRIISLPAYIGDEFGVAGMKWISSFPGNLGQGLDRASAVVVLNSVRTGRPEALIEGSIISARRTAASAALAAQTLHNPQNATSVGIIGCGLINSEITHFLRAAIPEIRHLIVFDLHADRMRQFERRCLESFDQLEVEFASSVNTVLQSAALISIATTAIQPYITDLAACAPGSTILHVSLRDLAPQIILGCDNVVDDVDHVCRAQTSVHLAEQLSGNRDFIRCTLADVFTGQAPARRDDRSITVFSPFGLGVLDIAVGKFVLDQALEQQQGTVIESFLPVSWERRSDEGAVQGGRI